MFEEYKDVLTTNEVANALQISVQTVRKLINNNKLKSLKIGKNYRVVKNDLIDFISNKI